MELDIYIFLSQCIIFCNKYDFTNARPMIGQNIELARDNDFPFIVAIIRVNNPHFQPIVEIDQVCTGTLISKQDVLSAAHCVMSDMPENIKVAIGSVNLRQSTRHDVLAWTTFQLWASQNNIQLEYQINDIASIRLRNSLPDHFVPVQVSNLPNKRLYGKKVIIAGWSRFNATTINLNMQTATVKVLSNKDCEKRLNKLETGLHVDKLQALCTVASPFVLLGPVIINLINHIAVREFREGDSGGPLLYHGTIVGMNVGICPNSVPYGHPKSVNFHLSVECYRNFILSMIH